MLHNFNEYLQRVFSDEFSAVLPLLGKERQVMLERGMVRYLAEWEQLIYMADSTLLPDLPAAENFREHILAEVILLPHKVLPASEIEKTVQNLAEKYPAFRALHARLLIFQQGSPTTQVKGLQQLTECMTPDNLTAHECARLVYEAGMIGDEDSAFGWKTFAQSTSFRRIWNEGLTPSEDSSSLRTLCGLIACGNLDTAAAHLESASSPQELRLRALVACLRGDNQLRVKMSLKAAADVGCAEAETLLKGFNEDSLTPPDTLDKGDDMLSMFASELRRQQIHYERLHTTLKEDVDDCIRRLKEEAEAELAEQKRREEHAEAERKAKEQKRLKAESRKQFFHNIFSKKAQPAPIPVPAVPAPKPKKAVQKNSGTTPPPPSQMRLVPKKKPLPLNKRGGSPIPVKKTAPAPLQQPAPTEQKKPCKRFGFADVFMFIPTIFLYGIIAWLGLEMILYICFLWPLQSGSFANMWPFSARLIKLGLSLLWLLMAVGIGICICNCWTARREHGPAARFGIQLLTILQQVLSLQMLTYTTAYCPSGFIGAAASGCVFACPIMLILFLNSNTLLEKDKLSEWYPRLIPFLIGSEVVLCFLYSDAANFIHDLETLHRLYS